MCAARLDQSCNRKGNEIRRYNLQEPKQRTYKTILWFDLVTADILDYPNIRN
jgi:hypothetical protein